MSDIKSGNSVSNESIDTDTAAQGYFHVDVAKSSDSTQPNESGVLYDEEAITKLIDKRMSDALQGVENRIQHLSEKFIMMSMTSSIKNRRVSFIDVDAESNRLKGSYQESEDLEVHCIESTLPEDTFSLMIMSRPLSVAWFLGLAISLVQITLLTIFLYIQIAAYFNVTEAFVTARNNYSNLTEVEVTINLFSKYISILVIFFFQGDMLESLKMLCTDLTYENGKWKKFVNPEEIQKSRLSKYLTTERSQWYMIVIFPTALKLFEGFLAYLVCVLFTLLSNGVIDLYQNFASLLIISELDDEGFRMAVAGFFGEKCQRISAVVLNTTLVEEVPANALEDGTCNYGSYNTAECLFDGGDCKNNALYPECFVEDPSRIGDGVCDGEHYNTTLCDFDGGDCMIGPLPKYPRCFVANPSLVGNNNCDFDKQGYNTIECGFDGGDCFPKHANAVGFDDCFVFDLSLLGDGICHHAYPAYNTSQCGYDGGDCILVEADEYPGCFVNNPDLLQNGICNDFLPNYGSKACGHDGGDCLCQNNQDHETCIEGLVPVADDRYPHCFVENPFSISDGKCDSAQNIGVCGYDGGDCINAQYPGCIVPNFELIGDGNCNESHDYNSLECDFDGGDCPPVQVGGYPFCFVSRPDLIGNGICNSDYPGYNSSDCGYDGGDCAVYEVHRYPGCYVHDTTLIDNGYCELEYDTEECKRDGGDCELKPVPGLEGCMVTNPSFIGDGICNYDLPNYYTEECAFDGGDCYLKKVYGYSSCYVDKPELIGDGTCQVEYDTKACNYDGGDCLYKTKEGLPGCFVPDIYLIANGECDTQNNVTECNFDGGDCL